MSTPLSKKQINSITGCPAKTGEYIANFTPFWSPRPTKQATGIRYIDVWPNMQMRDPHEAARYFCTKQGFRKAVFWNFERIAGDNAAAVRLKDNSVCRGNCEVFKNIFCE